MSTKRHLPIDGFVTAIVVTAVIACLLPARGFMVPVLDWAVKVWSSHCSSSTAHACTPPKPLRA